MTRIILSTLITLPLSDERQIRRLKLLESGYNVPLIQRDVEGRRVLLLQLYRINPDDFDYIDVGILNTWIIGVLMEEEETQIAGFIIIIDCNHITMKHLSMVPVKLFLKDGASVKNSEPIGRLKNTYIINLPSYAKLVYELSRKVTSKKNRKKNVILKNMTELKKYFDTSILPSELGEFGGKESMYDMIENFKKLVKEREQMYKKIDTLIDWDRIAKDKEKELKSCSIM